MKQRFANTFEALKSDPGPSGTKPSEDDDIVEESGAGKLEKDTFTKKDGPNRRDDSEGASTPVLESHVMVDKDPNDSGLRDKERACSLEYEKVAYDLELFLKQKAKVDWLKAGDSNTAFFHKMIKRNRHSNMVDRIIDSDGNVHDGDRNKKNDLRAIKKPEFRPKTLIRPKNPNSPHLLNFLVPLDSIGEVHSCMILMKGLEEFRVVSGLAASVEKSTVFFCQVPLAIKCAIMCVMPFEEVICNNRKDVSIWHDINGVERKFSIHNVWETIRYRSAEVDWYNIVWFTNCIPRHAFHVWLVCRKKLNTQDKMRTWDMNMRCCPLCVKDMDSHAHLFF
ncbi:hypothetical protein QVD17_06677 [Tagetes erecta]|uniref:Reverse transcriptase zinc-binding domain-containing protein n=1 Tax=Tagetes erecta TaxID=13708 RepID=A0AAD8LNV8_TARER|nr:hypothetical protein QVD17_06677 [Tagetes erecta]